MVNSHLIGCRVQIPVHTNAWMRGDRYGEIVKVTDRQPVMRLAASGRVHAVAASRSAVSTAYVRLDRSGRVCRFDVDDLAFL